MRSPDLLKTLREGARGVLPQGARIALGLSGGIDSIALLDLLVRLRAELDCHLVALHVNHGLSPKARLWEDFCAERCAQLGVAFDAARLDLGSRAGDSLEAMARSARYAALAAMAARHGSALVALAHHGDDQAETTLLQLLRGASPHGLAAMPRLRALSHGVRLWRPLLGVSRATITAYARSMALPFVDDESNADLRFRRNFLRNRIVPALAAGFPGYRAALSRAAERAAEAAQLLDVLAGIDRERSALDGGLSIEGLRVLGPLRARNAVRGMIADARLAVPDADRLAEFVRQALEARVDRHPALPIDAGKYICATAGVIRLLTRLATAQAAIHAAWCGERELRLPGGVLRFTPARGCGIDASRVAGGCCVRSRAGGERLRAAPNRPTRTLKNLFQEAGIPAPLRERWPLLALEHELVAVPGIAVGVDWQCPPGRDGWIVTWDADEQS